MLSDKREEYIDMRKWYKILGIVALSMLIMVSMSFSTQAAEISFEVDGALSRAILSPLGHVIFKGDDLSLTRRAGEPAIPSRMVKLLLPSDADLSTVEIKIEDVEFSELPVSGDVLPVKPAFTRSETGEMIKKWPRDKNIFNGRDVDIYENDDLFPSFWVSSGDWNSGCYREWKIVSVPVSLFRWNPVSGNGQVFDYGKIVVKYDIEPICVNSSSLSNKRRTGLDGAFIEDIVDNFDKTIGTYSSSFGLTNSSIGTMADDSGKTIAVITTDEIRNNSQMLSEYVSLRESRGDSCIVAVESDWGGGTGDIAAENIRSWLQTNYLDMGITHILLIGNPHPDTGDVPMKKCTPDPENEDMIDTPTDFYYAELTGNWDSDEDGIYGEWYGDWQNEETYEYIPGGCEKLADVSVSRIPFYSGVDTYADLDMVLLNSIKYSREERSDAETSRKSVLLPMEPVNLDPEEGDIRPSWPMGEYIKDMASNSSWSYHRIYDIEATQDGIMPPTPEVSGCNNTNVIEGWKTTKPGYVSWMTHGSSSGANDVLSVWDIPAIGEINTSPAVVFQGSCSNAYPEDSNNLSKALLYRNLAVLTIGCTRGSYYFTNGGGEYYGFDIDPNTRGGLFGYNYTISSQIVQETSNTWVSKILTDSKSGKDVFGEAHWANVLVLSAYGTPDINIDSCSDGVETSRMFLCRITNSYENQMDFSTQPITLRLTDSEGNIHEKSFRPVSAIPNGSGWTEPGGIVIFTGLPEGSANVEFICSEDVDLDTTTTEVNLSSSGSLATLDVEGTIADTDDGDTDDGDTDEINTGGGSGGGGCNITTSLSFGWLALLFAPVLVLSRKNRN